ncbi:uncharacterized protein K452DRAFT_273693 [Aplosporella prunicola CBS 121167]|uniref:Opi1-domain-containing protein n=1 Tax=Aplosporella prunicola CBS 121167 TaxID=1176127 RepID=A0A6A6B7N1_9PEZI|nr:uncharacterized protein K452DRAFT_273693 [Aplosporella prunicola CBS 121167]KAF2140139.1 hypothetical protein K452DRAFT_273693 [Aplosporella prunicola CBS 121167]
MEVRQEHPPAYTNNDPESLQLPSVPTQDPPSANATHQIHLPDLKSLGLPVSTQLRNASNPSDHHHGHPIGPVASDPQQWQTTDAIQHLSFPRVPLTAPRSAAEMDGASPMDTESVMSMDEQTHNMSLNSKELLAAEAIVGLGNPDFRMSPAAHNARLPSPSNVTSGEDPEPLLSLLTSSHPWLGKSINGSLNAYTSTKAYSPRFVQYSANFVERNVANTVGSVGRRTGVEGSIRRYLGERRLSDHDSQNHKRRRIDDDAMDIEQGLQTPPLKSVRARNGSDASISRDETLPPYDANRSPEYEERTDDADGGRLATRQKESQKQHWSTRVMITTSGLGAALSEKSLRSLKFCLGILRDANAHLSNVMRALKMVLEDYENATRSKSRDSSMASADEKGTSSPHLMRDERDEQSRRLAERMKALSEDIWQTLKKVVASVSQYTGGALPENAGVLVRRQLLSVPQRWQAASAASSQNGQNRQNGEPVEVRGANRMLAFAKEGLDMMAQVSIVVESTIVSAEKWLDSLGRKKNGEGESPRDEKSADSLPFHNGVQREKQ